MTAWADASVLKSRSGMAALSDDQADAALEAASDLLDTLTRYQYSVHTDTVRPEGCGRACDPGAPSQRAVVGWGLAQPLARVVGPWPLPGPYGGMADGCGCCGASWHNAITLQRPVLDVTSVKVDGTVLVKGDDYQVWDGAQLIRIDGRWPSCQNLTLASSEVGTFEVVYTHGQAVPALGVQAAVSVATELAKLWGWIEGICKLPQRVTQVNRQSVAVSMVDPILIIEKGGTGLTDADLFVASANRAPRRATIATPGVVSDLRRRTV